MDLLKELKTVRYCLAPNTYRTIRGQILSGDLQGARVGIDRAKARAEKDRAELQSAIDEIGMICSQYEEQGIDRLQTRCYRKAQKYMEELLRLKGGMRHGRDTGD